MSEYIPPDGLKVSILLGTSGYIAVDGLKVSINLTPNLLPAEKQYIGGDGTGFDSFSAGNPNIRLRYQQIHNAGVGNTVLYGQARVFLSKRYLNLNDKGIASLALGTATIVNKNKYIKVQGVDYLKIGQPIVQNSKRYLGLIGLNYLKFGQAAISYKEQKTIITGTNFNTYGTHLVAYAIRTVEMSSSNADMSRFGVQWIEYNPRYIQPRGIFEQLPSNHMVSPRIEIRPIGFDSASYGTRIIPEIQTIYPQGFVGVFGVSEIHNYKQYIKPKGFLTVGLLPEYRWGRADVWNKTKYILSEGVAAPNLNLPDIAKTKIENRNRIVATFGALHQRFGFQQLINNARLLGPIGIPSHLEVNPTKTMVADRIRYLRVKGIEQPIVSAWHHARLGARLIQPKGINASSFGSGLIENTRRNFRFIGMGDQSQLGVAMISSARRALSFEYLYTIAPPPIPSPKIKLRTRYVEPVGFNSLKTGSNELKINWNKIYPRFELKQNIGEPIVKNVTPEIKLRGLDMSEFGVARIDLYRRYIRPDGFNAAIYGQTKISDSKQIIQPIGVAAPFITRFNEVIRQGGQYIPHLVDFTGRGFSTKNFDDINLHKIIQNVIKPQSKLPMTEFGNTVVTANTIRVEPGYWEILMGTPSISNKNRRIFVSEFKDVFQPSKPTLSPHTIYAGIVNPPSKAIENHVKPLLPLHPIDGLDMNGHLKETGAVFGIPSISHFKRAIYLNGSDMSNFGDFNPKLTTLFIRPKGLNSFRMGMIAPIGSQHISFRKGLDDSAFGNVLVNHAEQKNRTIKLQGNDWLEFGKNEIQLLNRNIYPTGINSLQVGTKKDNDKPYMWQGLRIGAHIPTSVGGGDQSMFGLAWVSLRVREINPMGLDFAHINEYDYSEFELRMRVVRGVSPNQKPTQQIKPLGFNATMFNASNIKNRVHFIRPDGNSEQYRKGAF